MAVGIKQNDLVDKMVMKVQTSSIVLCFQNSPHCVRVDVSVYTVPFFLQFLSSNFVVMLFHYDGNVDKWKTFEWNDHVIHVSAVNQTKW